MLPSLLEMTEKTIDEFKWKKLLYIKNQRARPAAR